MTQHEPPKDEREGVTDTPGAARGSATKPEVPATESARKEGRIKRHMRTAGEIRRRPTSAIPMLRGAVIRLWVARGAGFYGLGYIMAFIVLEVHLITSELAESTGVSDFITSQALEYVLRVGFMSFVNGFLALLWPVYVLDLLGGLGILVLIGGYLAFEHVLKPVIERQLPELKAAREQAERTKQRTAETRKQKKGKAGKAAKSRGD